MKKLSKDQLDQLEQLYTAPPSPKVWETIADNLEHKKESTNTKTLFFRSTQKYFLAVAASVLLFLSLGIWFYSYRNQSLSPSSSTPIAVSIDREVNKIGENEETQKMISQEVFSESAKMNNTQKVESILPSRSPIPSKLKEKDSKNDPLVATISPEQDIVNPTPSNVKKQRTEKLVVLPVRSVASIAVPDQTRKINTLSNLKPLRTTQPRPSRIAEQDIKFIDQIKESAVSLITEKVGEWGEELNIRNSRRIKSIEIIY